MESDELREAQLIAERAEVAVVAVAVASLRRSYDHAYAGASRRTAHRLGASPRER